MSAEHRTAHNTCCSNPTNQSNPITERLLQSDHQRDQRERERSRLGSPALKRPPCCVRGIGDGEWMRRSSRAAAARAPLGGSGEGGLGGRGANMSEEACPGLFMAFWMAYWRPAGWLCGWLCVWLCVSPARCCEVLLKYRSMCETRTFIVFHINKSSSCDTVGCEEACPAGSMVVALCSESMEL